jgi:hypothetical protein
VVQARWRELREEAYQQGLAEFNELMKFLTFRDFVVLYIAEGLKRNVTGSPLGTSIHVSSRWRRAG